MRVALEEIPGVVSAEVSLDDGLVDVRLEPDNRVTVARLRSVIREQGFSPRAALVRVEGELQRREGELVLVTPARVEPFLLEMDRELASSFRGAAGTVVLEGNVAPDKDDRTPDRLRVVVVR